MEIFPRIISFNTQPVSKDLSSADTTFVLRKRKYRCLKNKKRTETEATPFPS